jgi:hypothetical protein
MCFSERIENQRVLDLGSATGKLLEADHLATLHPSKDLAFDESAPAWALGDEQGVVPGVLDLLLGRAGRSLNDELGCSRDRRGEVLA